MKGHWLPAQPRGASGIVIHRRRFPREEGNPAVHLPLDKSRQTMLLTGQNLAG